MTLGDWPICITQPEYYILEDISTSYLFAVSNCRSMSARSTTQYVVSKGAYERVSIGIENLPKPDTMVQLIVWI